MKPENQVQLLREPEIKPTKKVIEKALGKDVFEVYRNFMEIITSEFDLTYEWRYYKDGKAWLCKVSHKKKTILWLSVWEKIFKTGFYFTEKNRAELMDLEIGGEIKEDFSKSKAIGKLIPLILDINRKKQLNGLREIIKFKKGLK